MVWSRRSLKGSGMSNCKNSESRDSKEKFARIWLDNLAKFHGIAEPATWQFDEQHVIALLRSKLKAGMPTWKRLKAVEGLIWYRNEIRQSANPRLEPIRAKLQAMVAAEKLRKEELPIETVVGRINPRDPDIIQAFRRTLRLQGRAFNTEKAYVGKVQQFMTDRGLKNLADFEDIGGADVEAHLTDLAVDGDVASSTQNQAYHALLFLFEHVLKRDAGKINALRSTKGPRIPSVMSKAEVAKVLSFLTGIYLLIAQSLYGSGMRISECLRLRVKDVDFDQMLIEVHDSKGGKSRLVPLPQQLVEPLRRLVRSRRLMHEQDEANGEASVWLTLLG